MLSPPFHASPASRRLEVLTKYLLVPHASHRFTAALHSSLDLPPRRPFNSLSPVLDNAPRDYYYSSYYTRLLSIITTASPLHHHNTVSSVHRRPTCTFFVCLRIPTISASSAESVIQLYAHSPILPFRGTVTARLAPHRIEKLSLRQVEGAHWSRVGRSARAPCHVSSSRTKFERGLVESWQSRDPSSVSHMTLRDLSISETQKINSFPLPPSKHLPSHFSPGHRRRRCLSRDTRLLSPALVLPLDCVSINPCQSILDQTYLIAPDPLIQPHHSLGTLCFSSFATSVALYNISTFNN